MQKTSDFIAQEAIDAIEATNRYWVVPAIQVPIGFYDVACSILKEHVNRRTVSLALSGERVSSVLAINIRRIAMENGGRLIKNNIKS